jgi:methylase of polypeptide subunit release factors
MVGQFAWFTSLRLLNGSRDAGITLSCHISDLLDENCTLTKALFPSQRAAEVCILELGTGCGMVGIAIAETIGGSTVILTDLPEAQEIVERNISQAHPANGSTLNFQVLDWEDELPQNLQSPSSHLDLITAADCTYNADSR